MAKKSINIRAGFDMKAFSTSSQNLTRSLKSTGKKMQSVGKSMSMSLTAPIVALGGLAVKTFADFEQSMAKVKAISGATGKDFKALTQTAKDLGISTRFAASEVSDLMLNYSKLGFSSGEIQKITASTLDLALATGEDLATSAMVAGGTLRAFGLDASKMGMVTDVMAKSFSSSALDLNKFQVSMASIAPVAKGLGQSLQQTTAQLGVLVNNGIEASTAGTMLRNMMLKATKDGFSMDEALKDIASSTDKAGTALQYFDTRATATALVLAANIKAVKGLNDELLDSEGAAKDMADIMDKTLEGSMMKLKSATEGLGIAFGEILAPAIGSIASFLSDMAMQFAELSDGTKKTIVIIAALAAAIGPLIFLVGGLSAAFAFLLANPIVLAITAIVVAVGALAISMADVNDKIKEVSKSSKILTKASEEATRQISGETERVKSYYDALRQTNKGSKERADLIKTINRTYGTTLQNLEDESDFVKQLDSSYIDLIKSLKTKIKLSIKEDALTELMKLEAGILSITDAIEGKMFNEDLSINTDIPYDDFRFMQYELQKQNDLLNDNIDAQEKLLSGSFFDDVANGVTPTPSPSPSPIPSPSGEKDLTAKEQHKAIFKLKQELFEVNTVIKKIGETPILPVVDVEGLKTSLEKVSEDSVHIFAQMGREMGAALNNGLQNLATEGLISLGSFIGDSLTADTMMEDQLKQTENHYNKMIQAAQGNASEISRIEQEKQAKVAEIQDSFSFDNRVQDFGRGLLDSIGKFMGQFGEAMIAMGVAQALLQASIATMNPAAAIVGGVALVAAGAAISSLSKKGIDTSTPGSTAPSYSNNGFQEGYMNSTDIKISGRDLILVQERERAFRR